jgi:hypothetical protein
MTRRWAKRSKTSLEVFNRPSRPVHPANFFSNSQNSKVL